MERVEERRVESAGAGPRLVVAGGRRRPRLADDRDAVKKETSLRLLAFEVETGKPALDVEVFRLHDAELLNAKNSHASPTPIVDGDRIYVHFGAEGTAALSTAGTSSGRPASRISRSTATAARPSWPAIC